MTGATVRAVMAASRTGGAGSRGGRDDQPPSTRVRVVRGLGEIAPVFVSEGVLEHVNAGNLPDRLINILRIQARMRCVHDIYSELIHKSLPHIPILSFSVPKGLRRPCSFLLSTQVSERLS
jgi:hypothetical protein